MRRKGSKNTHGYYYTVSALQKKSGKLADQIDHYIDAAISNQQFNKLVDFDGLHKIKADLNKLKTLRIE